MPGIGTAARNWDDEQEQKKQQQGIGTPAANFGIGTPASNQGIGMPAANQGIGTAAANQGIGTAASKTQTQQPIQVMQGVTDETRSKMSQAQGGYEPSPAAQQAQANLQALQANRPQGYTSKYSAALDGILQQIQNPQEFKYEFNGDALFNSLKDQYTQQAKQAAVNAQGMAAGLTGGYGNSYAQMAGNQAYQQNILPLYDKGMEMAQMAYNRYRDNQANQYNQLQALMGMDESEYGRYRDKVSDWQNERNYLTDLYNTEEDRAYNRYANDLNYWTQLAQVENADYRSEQERQEAIRQFNMNYDLQQQQFEYNQAQDALAQQNWQTQFDYGKEQDAIANNLRQAQFDYGKEQDAIVNALRQAQFDYGKEQDALAQQNWQTQFDYGKEQDAIANALRQAQFDYGKEQDAQAQQNWQAQFDYGKQQDAQSQANWQAQFDYGKEQDAQAQANWQQQMDYQAMMDMLQQQNWQEQMNENIRQFNENLNWDKMSAQQKYAAEYAMNILAMGQMPSAELLMQAGLSAEDAQKMMAKISSGGATTQKPKTSTDDWDLPTAGLNVWLSDPANKEAIEKYTQQAAAKDVNNQLRNGQLPNASTVNKAGLNQTDVLKQYMQSNTVNPSAADLMNVHVATGGNVSTYGQKKKKDNN